MKRGVKKEYVSISPHLGRVSYGAGELRRVYVRHMSLGFTFSTIITYALLSSLWFLIDQETFNPTPQRIVRIFKYSEIELPRPLGDVEFGLSAYPVIEEQDDATFIDGSLPAISLRKKARSSKQDIPRERGNSKDLDDLPGPAGIDKLQADDKTVRKNFWGNERAPTGHDDIPGGSGESREPWRKGGVPVPGKVGEPPSGVDLSGIGSSSKPSAGTEAYGIGKGGSGDGEDGGGFSMRWLQGSTRRKISGTLPVYPPDANVSAQVRIVTTVFPNGTVRSVQPMQKANHLLEEAAMKAIRTWKFEPLGKSLPQIEQSCVITFSFKLK
jgi:TonB family protein